MQEYDVFVIGGGPGGYVAAIRASQLGLKVGLVEKENLGGVCLNWGCIPTKSLLKSASVFQLLKNCESFGVSAKDINVDFQKVINRSRNIAGKLSSGVEFLLKKNKVDIFNGAGSFLDKSTIQIKTEVGSKKISSKNIIVSTGAKPRVLEGLEPDHRNIWTYRDALVADSIPKSILIVGAGVIGIEFAYFFNSLGSKVSVIDIEENILSTADFEISDYAYRQLKNQGIEFIFASKVEKIIKKGDQVSVTILNNNLKKTNNYHKILSAVGIDANIDGLNLEKVGIDLKGSLIKVDSFCRTNIEGVFAIGDVTEGPWLAHKASHEGILVAEKIAGKKPKALDVNKIPACVYSNPQIASIGLGEKEAKNKYKDISIGKFPFSANGKALTEGEEVGFIKTIFVKNTGELVGAHMVGSEVTELIHGFSIGMSLESTEEELMNTIYPHPTLSEMIHESVLNAFDRALHI